MSRAVREDPVLIAGMHHSGTGLLARIAAMGGLFSVRDMAHGESRLFSIELDDELLMGGDWARNPILAIDEVVGRREAFHAFLDARLADYLLDNGYRPGTAWGFKDPRLCVLLPLYLERFPTARVVHIVRDADGVAASLSRARKLHVGRIHDPGFWKSLHGQHVARARELGRRIGDRYHELHYEALCTRPHEVVARLYEFLGFEVTPEVERFLSTGIYRDRVGAAC